MGRASPAHFVFARRGLWAGASAPATVVYWRRSGSIVYFPQSALWRRSRSVDGRRPNVGCRPRADVRLEATKKQYQRRMLYSQVRLTASRVGETSLQVVHVELNGQITAALFAAFVKCQTKAYLLASEEPTRTRISPKWRRGFRQLIRTSRSSTARRWWKKRFLHFLTVFA